MFLVNCCCVSYTSLRCNGTCSVVTYLLVPDAMVSCENYNLPTSDLKSDLMRCSTDATLTHCYMAMACSLHRTESIRFRKLTLLS